MRKIRLILLSLGTTLVAQHACADLTRSLAVESLYTKWLIDASPVLKEAKGFCWDLEDRIYTADDTPRVQVDSRGPYALLRLAIPKTDPSCTLTAAFNNDDISVGSSKSETASLTLKARLPYSKFSFIDNKGRRLDLLVEARYSELENLGFLETFRDSTFALRGGAVHNEVWQWPYLFASFEMPGFFRDDLLVSAKIGQSIMDFGNTGLQQGSYELGLAWVAIGERVPYRSPFSGRLRLFAEGVQIADPEESGVYPILAGQMAGIGVDTLTRLSPKWGVALSSDAAYSATPLVISLRLRGEALLSYALSGRWRIEGGWRLSRQSLQLPEDSTITKVQVLESFYSIGLSVRPY